MRYLIINYLRKASGQMDEIVSVSRNIKMRDLQTASVILDFKKQYVTKCSMDGKTVPKDWNRIVGFYYQFYKNVIDQLARENGIQIQVLESTDAKNNTD